MKKDLSVIIPSFNTKEITGTCIRHLLDCLEKQKTKVSCEILVVDNASTDGSAEMLSELPVTTVLLKENVGYSRANNIAYAQAKGRYILFLNSDVYVRDVQFDELTGFLSEDTSRAALTVRVNLETGAIDKASHRGFPTLWNSMCYYVGLEKLSTSVPFLRSIFGGYHLLDKDLTQIHEVDAISGAFFLVKKSALDKVGPFDEDFFMYGEDIDLAYRIKKAGFGISYYPTYQVLHLKYKSGIGTKDAMTQAKIRFHFYDAMKIFYKKHYEQVYHPVINSLVYMVISLKMPRI